MNNEVHFISKQVYEYDAKESTIGFVIDSEDVKFIITIVYVEKKFFR